MRTLSTLLACAALALVPPACSASPADDGNGASSDELRALREGDVDVPLVTGLAAQSPPQEAADVRTWDVDYVHTHETNPDDEFNGIAMFARDEKGAARFIVPVSVTDDGAALFFLKVVDTEGNSEPLDLDAAQADSAKAKDAQALQTWLSSEASRLRDSVTATVASTASPTNGGQLSAKDMSPQTKDALMCGAKVAVFALSTVATAYTGFVGGMLIQAGADALFGEWSSAATQLGTAGVVKGVGKVLVNKGMTTTAKVLGRGSLVGVGAIFVYTLAQKNSMREVMQELLPDSCIRTYDWIASTPTAPASK
jgi:hypothetical protein